MAPKATGRKRQRTGAIRRRQAAVNGSSEETGPDEAAAFMAEIVASLVRMARAQRLDVLTYLLSMAPLEAEEHVWLRSRRKLL
jgi:hypothetical protein